MPAPSKPRAKSAFSRWMWEHDVTLRAAAEALGCSHEHVRRICLQPDDPSWSYPDEELLARIATYTAGKITKDDFPAPAALQKAAAQ